MTADIMDSFGILSVLPPLLAIVLAIRTKQVFISLLAGLWLGWTIYQGWNPLIGAVETVERLVAVFADAGNTRVILFSALIGAIITLTQYSGGMQGFVAWVVDRGLVRTRRSAGLVAWFLGVVIFIESSICVLVSGAVSRPIFDRLRISREKLAYILDSTSAPKCVLIPLNAWGAFVLGLLAAQQVEAPVEMFVASIPYNFYAIIAVLLVVMVVVSGRDAGPMIEAERRVREEGLLHREGAAPLVSDDVVMLEAKPGVPLRAINMVLPVAVMIVTMPVALWLTGGGNLMAGSGSTSVLWSVIAAIVTAGLAYRLQGILSIKETTEMVLKGAGGLIPLAVLMMLAFAIGDLCGALGTGPYVARVAQAALPAAVIPAVVFIVSGFIAFSTGTSWGTFAIMIPIAIPMVALIDLNAPLMVAAVLGGGVFGDHCSPISDTTIISSMASACDHIDHVRTQLPYALAAGLAAVGLYLVAGILT